MQLDEVTGALWIPLPNLKVLVIILELDNQIRVNHFFHILLFFHQTTVLNDRIKSGAISLFFVCRVISQIEKMIFFSVIVFDSTLSFV